MASNYFHRYEGSFLWKIKNFSLSPKLPIRSPEFCLDSSAMTKFSLYLCSRDKTIKSREKNGKGMYVKLKRHKPNYVLSQDENKYILSLKVTENGEEKYGTVLCTDIAKCDDGICWRWSDLVEDGGKKNVPLIKRKDDLFLDHLDIRLKIMPTSSASDEIWVCKLADLESLSTDLAIGMDTNDYHNIQFRTAGDIFFKAHKPILCCRYPKLVDTLQFRENENERFHIGTDSDSLKVLLKYIYTGKIEAANVPCGIYDLLDNFELHHLSNLLLPGPDNIVATTTVRTRQCIFNWSFPNFSSIPEKSVLNYSFCCDKLLKWTKLKVMFYFTQNDEREQCVSFSIQRIFPGITIRMKCKISILDAAGSQKEYDHVFVDKTEWKISNFIKRKNLIENKDTLLPGDILKVKFEFKISDGVFMSDVETVSFAERMAPDYDPIVKDIWTLQQDLLRLFRNPVFSDVTLCVGKERFPAHKIILSLRSPEFRDIFQKQTLQEQTAFVVINGFEPPVVQAMLVYIYGGQVNDSVKNFEFVASLYAAAHEYKVLPLKQKCGNYFKQVLHINNIVDILLLADSHCDDDLQKYVHDFVCLIGDDFMKSGEWERIARKRLDLAEWLLNVIITYAEPAVQLNKLDELGGELCSESSGVNDVEKMVS